MGVALSQGQERIHVFLHNYNDPYYVHVHHSDNVPLAKNHYAIFFFFFLQQQVPSADPISPPV